ncbi:MAG: hypothetical protein P0Y66_22075 [Candidatus Kaistia colombiensis]|nr:MAG: hypothetical protein P0Y66_22075 [Kaistia sp.]
MTAPEKIVESVTLLALSRLAMVATPVLMSVAGALFWIWISAIQADARAAADITADLRPRVAALEGTQLRSQDQLISQLSDINRSLVEQGKQIAALTATIEALKGASR